MVEICGRSEGCARAVLHAGAVEPVARAMRALPREERVRADGIGVLASLASCSHDGAACVLRARGAELVAGAMRFAPAAAEVQERGCRAVGALARASDRGVRALVDVGAPALCAAAVDAHPADAHVLAAAACALCDMCCAGPSTGGREAVIACRGVEAVVLAALHVADAGARAEPLLIPLTALGLACPAELTRAFETLAPGSPLLPLARDLMALREAREGDAAFAASELRKRSLDAA